MAQADPLLIKIPTLRSALSSTPVQEPQLVDLQKEVVDLWEENAGGFWDKRTGHVETCRPQHDKVRTVYLSLRPVETITTVRVRSRIEDDFTTLDADDYRLVDFHLVRRDESYWPDQYGEVEITYDGGYEDAAATNPTPHDVLRALKLQAQFLAIRMAPEKVAVKSQNFKGGAGTYEDAYLHPFFKQLAKKKKRRV